MIVLALFHNYEFRSISQVSPCEYHRIYTIRNIRHMRHTSPKSKISLLTDIWILWSLRPHLSTNSIILFTDTIVLKISYLQLCNFGCICEILEGSIKFSHRVHIYRHINLCRHTRSHACTQHIHKLALALDELLGKGSTCLGTLWRGILFPLAIKRFGLVSVIIFHFSLCSVSSKKKKKVYRSIQCDGSQMVRIYRQHPPASIWRR